MHRPQVASKVLMVRPTTFGFNTQAAETNAYMHKPTTVESGVRDSAIAEFDAMVGKLKSHDIDVVVWDDAPVQPLPDAVFPNNWMTAWPDGSVFLYPMGPTTRRGERRPEVVAAFSPNAKIVDLSASERQETFLEGTGAMVFDHDNQIVYGALSARCNQQLFEDHAHSLGYKPIPFHTDNNGTPVYHANIVIAIQPTTAVLCSEVITDPAEYRLVYDTLARTHEVVEITKQQMVAFCANVLPLANRRGEQFLVLSQEAHDAFTEEQRQILGKKMRLLPVPLPTIEQVGGGSARCMLAEVF